MASLRGEPQMKDLVNHARVDDPYRLGLELNLTPKNLNIVKRDSRNYEEELVGVFELYLKQTEVPSWQQVVKAVRTIGENKLAESIVKKLGCPAEEVEPPQQDKSPSLVRRPVHSGSCPDTPAETNNSLSGPPSPSPGKSHWPCSMKWFAIVFLIMGGITVIVVGPERLGTWFIPKAPQSHSMNKNTVNTPSTPTPEYSEEWLTKKPTAKLLAHIKYTNSHGQEQSFYFINEVQVDCMDIGTELGIDQATLDGFKSTHKTPSEICKSIFNIWIKRGEQVTWKKLLQVLKDLQLGGIEKDLREALSYSPEVKNST